MSLLAPEDTALLERARAWAAADPDPSTRAELEALIAASDFAELRERMGPELDFGTAGLRGKVGAGSARMNLAVVTRVTRALGEHLLAAVPDARALGVVIGHDARPTSPGLAAAASDVLRGLGLPVRSFDGPVPTPLVAYAVRAFGAAGGIVLTASHNPREDNGYKVYGADGSQLGAAPSADIARRRAALPTNVTALAPRAERTRIDDGLFERYLAELDASLPARSGEPALRIAYTPLHGVGLAFARRALARRGFRDLHVVPEQAEPDGAFPTTPFPNPEEPGTLDLVNALARSVSADVVIANDPDADRLAAGVVLPSGRVEPLSGNELGVLLADFVLAHAPARPQPLLVTSVVSTPLLARVAEAHGARSERTLTGFRWIWAAGSALEASGGVRFAYGCEEALGYSIGHLVRDKDGISAAVWLAELAARAARDGRTLLGLLHDLFVRHGAWASAQRSLVRQGVAGTAAIAGMVAALRAAPPETLLGAPRAFCVDYRELHQPDRPWLERADLLEFGLATGERVLVRPSGTEPKLKIYADAVETVAAGELPSAAHARAKARAAALAAELAERLESYRPRH